MSIVKNRYRSIVSVLLTYKKHTNINFQKFQFSAVNVNIRVNRYIIKFKSKNICSLIGIVQYLICNRLIYEFEKY